MTIDGWRRFLYLMAQILQEGHSLPQAPNAIIVNLGRDKRLRTEGNAQPAGISTDFRQKGAVG
jgi:hypothetical protein